MFARNLFLVSLIYIGALCGAAEAKSSAELEALEQQLQNQQERAGALRVEEKMSAANVAQLQHKLVTATHALQEKQNEAEALEEKLELLTTTNKAKTDRLEKSRAELAGLMTALVALSREPPEPLLLHREMTSDQINRGILLRDLLPRVKEKTEKLSTELAEIQHLRQSLDQQKKLVAEGQANLAKQKLGLDGLLKSRQGNLQKTAAERAEIDRQLAALSKEAGDLRQLMQKVTQSMALPGRVEKDTRDTKLNRGLRMPVSGRITRPYGVRDASGVVSQGLTITSGAGSPIVAPTSGRVVFVGTFKGYGQIVILAHTGGYHSLLAGFGRIDVDLKQDVVGGEPLGVLPDSISRPELYFEWRFRNDPVDPAS